MFHSNHTAPPHPEYPYNSLQYLYVFISFVSIFISLFNSIRYQIYAHQLNFSSFLFIVSAPMRAQVTSSHNCRAVAPLPPPSPPTPASPTDRKRWAAAEVAAAGALTTRNGASIRRSAMCKGESVCPFSSSSSLPSIWSLRKWDVSWWIWWGKCVKGGAF